MHFSPDCATKYILFGSVFAHNINNLGNYIGTKGWSDIEVVGVVSDDHMYSKIKKIGCYLFVIQNTFKHTSHDIIYRILVI